MILALDAMESWAQSEPRSLPHLALMHRLAAEDQAKSGEDGVAYLVRQAARTFDGTLPLAYAEVLLGDLFGDSAESPGDYWSRGQIRRLQALLAERAFAVDLEVPDLVEIAAVYPSLGAAFGCTNPDRLAKIRLVWDMSENQPWRKVDAATTVFDLARDTDEGEPALEAQSDLLLVSRQSGIVVGSDGVWLKDSCFVTLPRQVEVTSRHLYNEDGYDLIAGPHRFWFAHDPSDLRDQLQEWLWFYFRDFVPKVTGKQYGSLSEAGQRLLIRNAISCPRCRQEFVPAIGRLGLLRQEAETAKKQPVDSPNRVSLLS